MGEIVDLFADSLRRKRQSALDHIGKIYSPDEKSVSPCAICLKNNWRLFVYEQCIIGYCCSTGCDGQLIVDR